ncbi:hypothetical protein KHA80_18605 [Anaerobacillus sp. HL2]|nr:hypothetical protein KHA80_18605 [Anaerobacillus sp. HL2]
MGRNRTRMDQLTKFFNTISNEKWFKSYTNMVNELLDLVKHVSNQSGLILDDKQYRYYLTSIVINDLPKLIEFRANTSSWHTKSYTY